MHTTYVTRGNIDGWYIQTIGIQIVQTIGGKIIPTVYITRTNEDIYYIQTYVATLTSQVLMLK